MSAFTEFDQYDGLGLAELVQRGEVSALELLEAAIERAERLNPRLNAIVHRCDERALERIARGLPEGPFHGVPFVLKDLLAELAGEPMTMGSRAMLGHVPPTNSRLVDRYEASGVAIFAKTNCPEFGLIITTEPKAHGPAHNPHRSGFSTGGSSGGSAAAVAAGIVPMANGDDGGGSIRLPASWCGVIGLKPTRGMTPLGPSYGELWGGAVSQHVLTRSVRDCAAMLDATAGKEPGAPYQIALPDESFLAMASRDPGKLRVAIARRPLAPDTTVDPEVYESLEATGRDLEAMGHHVDYADPDVDSDALWHSFFTIVAGNVAAIQKLVRDLGGRRAVRKFEPATKCLAMLGRSVSARSYVLAQMQWHEASMAMAELFERHDVMLCPTVPTPAVPHGELPPSRIEEWLMTAISPLNVGKLAFSSGLMMQLALPVIQKMAYTVLCNVTGLPGISIPTHRAASGLPIGMQLVAPFGEEGRLLALSGQIERSGLLAADTAIRRT